MHLKPTNRKLNYVNIANEIKYSRKNLDPYTSSNMSIVIVYTKRLYVRQNENNSQGSETDPVQVIVISM